MILYPTTTRTTPGTTSCTTPYPHKSRHTPITWSNRSSSLASGRTKLAHMMAPALMQGLCGIAGRIFIVVALSRQACRTSGELCSSRPERSTPPERKQCTMGQHTIACDVDKCNCATYLGATIVCAIGHRRHENVRPNTSC